MYQFARAAVTKYQSLGGLNNRNLLSQSSGGQKSEIKVSVGVVPSEGYEEETVSCLSPGFWWFSGNLCCSLAFKYITEILTFISTWHFPYVLVCL